MPPRNNTDALADAYRRAWRRIVAEQARIASDPRQFRRRDRLDEMLRRIAAEMSALDASARAWVQAELPRIYGAGARVGALAMGKTWAFTQIDRDAVQLLAQDAFDDLLRATTYVTDSSKRLVREIVKTELLTRKIVGESPAKARRLIKDFLNENGIHSVVYRNGARHTLDDYAEMVLRTKSAVASNTGLLNSASSVGARYFEVFDGPECQWESHNFGGQALGMIVTKKEALAHIIAHPRCRRSFGPRPDVKTKADAKAATGSVTAEQIQAQIAQDIERTARLERRAATKRRGRLAGRGTRRAVAGHVAKVRQPAPRPARRPEPPPPVVAATDEAWDSWVAKFDLDELGEEATKADVLDTLEAIEKIHRDGPLHRIPVNEKPSVDANGTFFPRYKEGSNEILEGDRIGIWRNGDHRAMTFAHETGHFMDLDGLGDDLDEGIFASELAAAKTAQIDNLRIIKQHLSHSRSSSLRDAKRGPDEPEQELDEWWEAVSQSETIKEMIRRRDDPSQPLSKKWLTYATQPLEIFARSYAQYIGTKAPNSVIGRELKRIIRGLDGRNPRDQLTSFLDQWTEEDFEKIFQAFENYFRRKGWLVEDD